MAFGIVDAVEHSSAGFKSAFVHSKSKLVRALNVQHWGLHPVGKDFGENLEVSFQHREASVGVRVSGWFPRFEDEDYEPVEEPRHDGWGVTKQ